MLNSISNLIQREVSKIQEELRKYSKEELVWEAPSGISNSAGNLALHVAGNLQHFIGSELGDSGYQRNRELEFDTKNQPIADLIGELENTKREVSKALENLKPDALQKEFPIQVFDRPMITEWFLLHLLSHTTYHLGQINYHRRLLSSAS